MDISLTLTDKFDKELIKLAMLCRSEMITSPEKEDLEKSRLYFSELEDAYIKLREYLIEKGLPEGVEEF